MFRLVRTAAAPAAGGLRRALSTDADRIALTESRRRSRQGTINVAVSFGLIVLSWKVMELKHQNYQKGLDVDGEKLRRTTLETALRDPEWLQATATALKCSKDELAARIDGLIDTPVEEPASVPVMVPDETPLSTTHLDVLKRFGNLP
eukprot:TRINITY_DN5380_c0_g1_i1.p1 TRINITY_DN5380_c0_g1~~TRINITY_DN5380_c0_g1_i1.p1  ORF type:complete len:148 (-),score=32.38 TRINITY_DN5380_c0_g1_i1:118-561(-)